MKMGPGDKIRKLLLPVMGSGDDAYPWDIMVNCPWKWAQKKMVLGPPSGGEAPGNTSR